MNKIAIYLNQHLVGNVFDKDSILEQYATDRSILSIKPRFVAMPKTSGDIKKILIFANQLALKDYELPIAVRGNGFDKTGATLTPGMVISMKKMNHIREIDRHSRLIRVEAGVTLGQLNSALQLHGLTLPINAQPEETIGGLIANCKNDSYAVKYGGIIKCIERIEVLLPNGDFLQTLKLHPNGLKQKQALKTPEGAIYRNLTNILENYATDIEKLKNTSSDSSGYPAITCLKNNNVFDLTPIFLASQGTLGIITEVILRCTVLPPPPQKLLATFKSRRRALEFLDFALTLRPLETMLYDLRIFEKGEDFGKALKFITKNDEGKFLVSVSFNDKKRTTAKKIAACTEKISKKANLFVDDGKTPGNNLSSAIVSYLNHPPSGERVAFLDDFYIPAPELPSFLDQLTELETEFKIDLPIFGSFATDNYNIRPAIELETTEGRQLMMQILKAVSSLISSCHGSFTGGSPEGRTKALVVNSNLDEQHQKLFDEIKKAFDPNRVLNPDIKLGADARSIVRYVRTSYSQDLVL